MALVQEGMQNKQIADRLCIALLAALALPAMAQQAQDKQPAADGKVRTLDRLTVTGSRIQRTEIEQALPVTSVTRAQIDAAGITCGDFIGSEPETQLIVSAWTAGYASAGKDAAKIDVKAFARHEKAVQTACAKNKKQLLLPTVGKSWQ